MSMLPLDVAVLTPDIRLTAPPSFFAALPAFITKMPPVPLVVSVDSPAVIDTAPPSAFAEFEGPTVTKMFPAFSAPAFDEDTPVPMLISPLAPSAVVPELKVRDPLTPSVTT